MFVLEQSAGGLQRSAVVLGDESGGFFRVKIEGGLADDDFARLAELLLGGPVDQQILPRSGVLHRDLRGDVIDDLAQEGVVAVALLFQVAALGNVFDRGDPSTLRERGVDDLKARPLAN